MKRNIRILIIVSILGLIGLTCIQGFLINNTYKLEKDVFIEETKRTIFRFDDTNQAYETIYDSIGGFVVERIIDYKLGRIHKDELLNGITEVQDSLNTHFINLYQNTFKKLNLSYPVKFQKRLKSVILLDSMISDTLIYKPSKTESLFLLGETIDLEDAYGINNSQTTTDIERDYMENGVQKSITINFQVVIQDYFSITGWRTKVLNRMISILILSIFIFGLVIGLLYYSIKNLITQKKIAEVKTDFINNITHELKTPLATLSLSTKMLKKDAVLEAPKLMENTINTIDRQTLRLQKLIDQVLNNSIGYNAIPLQREELNIREYLNTVLDDFQLSMNNDNVSLERDITKKDASIRLDKFYFTTALTNILENAVKYNSGKLNIHFKAELDTQLTIMITDNGVGIPKQHQVLIFDKFYRASDREIHNVKGLGLGLYYTKQIIKAHQGSIEVQSKKGQGATFTITIPLEFNK